jgi:hypothetical protein
MMLLDMPRDASWNEIVDWQPAREPFANHRRRNIARVRVDEKNLRRTIETLTTFWRWGSAERSSGTRWRPRRIATPGRAITTKWARSRTPGYPCHAAIPANASVPE